MGKYFDGSWKLGTAKVLKSGKHWYLHIAVTKEVEQPEFKPSHVVGIDRGLRQLLTIYDEKGQTTFVNGKTILQNVDIINVYVNNYNRRIPNQLNVD